MKNVPERFTWAADLVAPLPADHVLEIGCGAGLLIGLLATRLTTGELIALDKSGPMLQKAAQRNAAYITAGKVTLVTSEFANYTTAHPFDRIVSFNVNFFWKGQQAELKVLRQLIKPKGKIFAFFDTPFNNTIPQLAAQITQHLQQAGFGVLETVISQAPPRGSFCMIIQPAKKTLT
ncbi:class I SAM-dependent methyltransferase [Chitinophaga oryzae]|uniref:Class I SAM-dependent methyltransferase n=1 Tax=Chitinophaga oryzae TaxID=2725414 RepID=A0AAE6ZFV4_9BACT|nr:class I SAM-dependent methyltransferase [Chitinophaga oryzae]QJB31447.1 class I SAM-dependent methyltransferase [Chitinophaga oryzae]QJB37930.1 class I SAM-dependent methyltransferase [Chitinophaga oryzae]